MTTYCAPCLADLALVREATTAVNGTASCMAHAVLLTHPGDDPQRRRSRLAALRANATEKLETVGPEERLRLEVLVEEYALASAMESLVPRRRPDGPRGGGQPGGGQQGQPGEGLSRSARKRRGRDRDRPATGAAVADGSAEQAGAAALEQVGAPSGEPPAPGGDRRPAPGQSDHSAGAPLSLIGEAAPAGVGEPGGGPVGGDAEPTGAPAESTGAPAEPSSAPAEPSSAPAEAAGAPAEPSSSAPAEPSSAPAEAAGGLASDAPGAGEAPTREVQPGVVAPTTAPTGDAEG